MSTRRERFVRCCELLAGDGGVGSMLCEAKPRRRCWSQSGGAFPVSKCTMLSPLLWTSFPTGLWLATKSPAMFAPPWNCSPNYKTSPKWVQTWTPSLGRQMAEKESV